MRIQNAIRLAAAAGLIVGAAAFAQSGDTSTQLQTASGPVTVTSHEGTIDPNTYRIDFDAVDTNHDGYISRAEANAGGNGNLIREFRQVVDANHDGRLSREELKAWTK